MKILDLSAGHRAIWFDKEHPDCTFIDIRPEVAPSIVADSRALDPQVGEGYDLIVFDPPHANYGQNSRLAKNYGYHKTLEIRDLVRRSSKEAARVAKPGALMVFKWNTHDQPLGNILSLLPEWEPLVGTPMVSRRASGSLTYWVLLRRRELGGWTG